MTAARWLRLGLVEPLDLHAAYAGLAEAQPPDAPPIVLWARAKTHLCLGQSQGLNEIDASASVPVVRRPLGGGLVWVDECQHVFVLVVPLKHAPGRPARWYAWALAPAVATYRAFGLPAYQAGEHGEDIWLHGRKIAGSGAATIGGCAVVASSFLLRFPGERFAACVASPSPGFRDWLRDGLALAMTQWAEHRALPAERDLEDALRERIAAQHGWRFETSWPDARERAAIAGARDELAEPIEAALPCHTPGGIKLNARSRLVEETLNDRRERTLTVDGRVYRRRAI